MHISLLLGSTWGSVERTPGVNSILLNTLLMALSSHHMAGWLVLVSTLLEVFFTLVYSAEAGLKIFAVGFCPYWRSRMNRRATP